MGAISTEQLHALERELTRYIIREPDMLTKPGETCFYQCPATAVRIRAAEVGKHESGNAVFHKKSISQLYKSGYLANSSGMQRNVAEKYPGTFFITNERFYLMTAPNGLNLPLTDIFIINFYSDGFAIMARGRTYMVETLHANHIRDFLQKAMLHISYYEEIAAGLSGVPLPDFEDAFDFRKVKMSLDLLCNKKTPAAAVMELAPPPPKAEPPAEKKPKTFDLLLQKKAADVLLWLLALFLVFYFVFPFLMEVEWKDIQNLFGGTRNGYTVTVGDMQEIPALESEPAAEPVPLAEIE